MFYIHDTHVDIFMYTYSCFILYLRGFIFYRHTPLTLLLTREGHKRLKGPYEYEKNMFHYFGEHVSPLIHTCKKKGKL